MSEHARRSPFMQLPREVRDLIYECLDYHNQPPRFIQGLEKWPDTSDRVPKCFPAICAVNRQLYYEATRVFLQRSFIQIADPNESLDYTIELLTSIEGGFNNVTRLQLYHYSVVGPSPEYDAFLLRCPNIELLWLRENENGHVSKELPSELDEPTDLPDDNCHFPVWRSLKKLQKIGCGQDHVDPTYEAVISMLRFKIEKGVDFSLALRFSGYRWGDTKLNLKSVESTREYLIEYEILRKNHVLGIEV